MKRGFRYCNIVLIVSLLFSLFQLPVSAADPTPSRKSMNVARTAMPPLIDGKPDESVWQMNEALQQRTGTGDFEDARFGMLWDYQYLYIAVTMKDDRLVHEAPGYWFDQDNISMFFDPTLHRSAPFAANDMQIGLVYQPDSVTPTFQFGAALNNHSGKDEKKILRAIRTTDQGWTSEIAVPWSMLSFDPMLTKQLGFEMGVTDRDDAGAQARVSYWSAFQSNSFWNDTTGYGTLHLDEQTVTYNSDHVLLQEDFEQTPAGQVPFGWISDVNTGSPAFSVTRDTYGSRLSFEGNASGKQARITAPVQWDHYVIESDMRFEKVLNSERWASVMFRVPANGKNPYNQMAVRQSGKYEMAYRTPSNSWSVPVSGSWKPLALQSDYTLKVRVADNRVKEYIKAKNDPEYTLLMDKSFTSDLLERGKVGYQGDQVNVSFDNLKVTRIMANRLDLNVPGAMKALSGPVSVTGSVYYSDGLTEPVGSDRIKWYSSDETVLKVVDNQLYPLKQGQATIKAVYLNATAEKPVTVEPSGQAPAVISLQHDKGYILAAAEQAAQLNQISFNASFSDFTSGTLTGDQLEWSSADPAVTFASGKMTVSRKGVYTVQARKDQQTVQMLVVAKAAADSEYVLYEQNFDGLADGAMPEGWSRIEGSTPAKAAVKGNAFEIDATASPDNPSRVLLPEYLGLFGNYRIEADITHLAANDSARWNSIMYRIQNNNFPYYQMAVRKDATAANGVEFAERTPQNAWNVQDKGSYTEAIDASKLYRYTVKVHGNRVQELINNQLIVNNDLASVYAKGRIGLQANGSKMKVDNIRVSLQEEALPPMPADRFVNVTEPDTSLSLAPTVVAEFTSLSQLGILSGATLPATVVLHINENLKVTNPAGTQQLASLEEVLAAIDAKVIPAFYVKDEETVTALVERLQTLGIEDAFVISSDGALVKKARLAYPILRGIVDFTSSSTSSNEDLMQIRRTTNSSLAKIALLPEAAASVERVAYLQERLVTVWLKENSAAAGSNPAGMQRLVTSGTNGIVTETPSRAFDALKLYKDGVSLIRKPLNIGHRGIPALAPENTMAGYKLAYEHGADVLETDIYLTKDNQIVIMHDPTLERTTTGTGNIEDYTLEQLKAFKANKQFPAQYPDEGIPTLAQMFDEFKGKDVLHFVEIKSYKPEIVAELVKLIQDKQVEDQVVVISFTGAQLQLLGQQMPGMSAGFLTGGYANEANVSRSLRETLKVIQPLNTTFNTSYDGLGEKFMEAAKHRGTTVWPWTFRNQNDYIRYYEMGTYGLTTDYAHWASDWTAGIKPKQSVYPLALGQSVSTAVYKESYDREVTEAVPEIILISGGEFVEVNGNVVTGKQKGTAHALLAYKTAINESHSYTMYTQPVTFEVETSSPTLKLSGPEKVYSGESYELNVEVSGMKDVYGAAFKLHYDPALLEIADADSSIEGVQISKGSWMSEGHVVQNAVDPATGIISFAQTLLGNSPGSAGSGNIAKIQFRVKGSDAKPVSFTPVEGSIKFADSNNNPIEVQASGYQAQVADHKMTVTGRVAVPDKHHLDKLDGFNVSLLLNGVTSLDTVTGDNGSYQFSDLGRDSYQVEVAKDSYLKAKQSVPAGGSSSPVLVPDITMYVGDFDGSGKIDIMDIVWLAKAYDKQPDGDLKRYDVDADGDIDIFDVTTVASNFNRQAE
ncbi:glycerophosphodiester phosphodiesterase family protein [Paenibacillus sp. NPDC056579]|uniref:glycerophosphodiester phosphodiesterase family protein n=1 Tax=Paenibacillus sp. NPDC056579 TaxID=3345871 RepID=UPI00367F7B58